MIHLELIEYIYGKLIKNGQDLSGYTIVARSKNLELSLVELTREAVFLGQASPLIEFQGSFALGEVKGNTEWIVFSRSLWNDQPSKRGRPIHEHHLLLEEKDFIEKLKGNFRPLADYFYRRYPQGLMPTFSKFTILPGLAEVEVQPESERLATLWTHLKTVIHPNLVHNLLLALFYDNKVSISHFPRTKNPRADEELALDVTELITLLLPLPWRPQLTFATQLFEPDRSPVRLRFDIGRDDRIRVNWKDGEVWYASTFLEKEKNTRYAYEVVSLLKQERFYELAERIAKVNVKPNIQKGTRYPALALYKAWAPITEDLFLNERIEQSWVTLSRWLVLLRTGDLDSRQKAIGLAKLTHSMLRDQKGKLKNIWHVVPNYISQADLSVYQERVRPALEQAPQSAKGLFEVWLQEPAFRAQPACLELSRDLVGHLAKEDWQQASDFIASVWDIFPTTFPVSRANLIEACTAQILTTLDIKRFILGLWKLEGLRQAELAALLKAPSLNQLPPTRQVITLLAGQPAIGTLPDSLLYDAYEQNWNTARELFLFGVIKLTLELEQQDFLQRFLWNEKLIELAKWVVEPDKLIPHDNDPKKRETIESNRRSIQNNASTYRALLEQLLDLVAEQLEALATDTRSLYNHLAGVLGHFHYLTTSLIANLPSGRVTEEWLSDLKFLSEQQQNALQTQVQARRIIEDSNWSKRDVQIQFDNDLSIARALAWDHVSANPAIVEAIQLLQNGPALTLPDKDSLLPLLDWLLDRDYHNTPVRKQLLLEACRVALRESTVSDEPRTWQDVSERFFRSPVEENNQWLQENLNVLSVVELGERTTLLRELDRQRPDSFSSQEHGILNHTINILHANWFLAHLASAHQELPFILLPPLRQEASSEPFVRKISLPSLDRATRAVKLLLEWGPSGRLVESKKPVTNESRARKTGLTSDSSTTTPVIGKNKQRDVLNWVAESWSGGLAFLTDLVKKANQDGFMAETVSLIRRLNDRNARRQMLAACSKNLKQLSHVKRFILAVVEWPRLTDADFGTLQFNLQTWGRAHHSGIPLSNSLALPSTSLLFSELSEKRPLMNGGLLVSSWEEMDQEPAYLFDMLRHLFSLGCETVVDGQVVKALVECEKSNQKDFRPLATKHLAGVLAPLTSLQRFKSLNPQTYSTLDLAARYAPSLYPQLIGCYLTLYEWDQQVSNTLKSYSKRNGQDKLKGLLEQLVAQGSRNNLHPAQEVRYYHTLAFQAANDFQRLAPANPFIPKHRQDAQNRFSELLKQHPEMRTQYRISVSLLIKYQSTTPLLWAIAFADELHKAWSSEDKKNTYKFKDLIDQIAQYVYRSLNVVPITCLGEQLETLSPNELYILLQSCFSLWQRLEELLKEAEPSEENLISRGYSTIKKMWPLGGQQNNQDYQEPPLPHQDLTNIYAQLRAVWMNLIVQLRIQRKQLPPQWGLREAEKDNTYYLGTAYHIFEKASQAYRTVFQDANDFDDFVLLALQLNFCHVIRPDLLWWYVSKLRGIYKEKIVGKDRKLKRKFVYLLQEAIWELLEQEKIAAQTLNTKEVNIAADLSEAVTDTLRRWEVKNFIQVDLPKFLELVSGTTLPDFRDREALNYAVEAIRELDNREEISSHLRLLSERVVTPLVKDKRL